MERPAPPTPSSPPELPFELHLLICEASVDGRTRLAFSSSSKLHRAWVRCPEGRPDGLQVQLPLCRACSQGPLAGVRWLTKFLSPTREDARSLSRPLTAEDLCGGSPSSRGGRRLSGFRATPLSFSCGQGHLDVAKWLTKRFGLTAEDARIGDNLALRWSCMNGHLATARWLVEGFGLAAGDARIALQLACSDGRLATAQWLMEAFEWPDEDADLVLCVACMEGQLATVRWLVERSGHAGTQDGALSALTSACQFGHVAVAQWLSDHYGLRGAAMGAAVGAFLSDALSASLRGGHLAVTRWLVGHFGLAGAEAPRIIAPGPALGLSCERGHLASAQWLADHFGLTAEVASTSHCRAWRGACKNNHLHVVQWLLEWADPGPKELSAIVRRVRPGGAANRATQWLIEQHGERRGGKMAGLPAD